jgi:hypothetical protein
MEKAREVLSSAHPQENIYAVIARAFDAIRDEAEARGRASMKEDAAKWHEAQAAYDRQQFGSSGRCNPADVHDVSATAIRALS